VIDVREFSPGRGGYAKKATKKKQGARKRPRPKQGLVGVKLAFCRVSKVVIKRKGSVAGRETLQLGGSLSRGKNPTGGDGSGSGLWGGRLRGENAKRPRRSRR